jgi:Zn-dependent protease
MPKPIWILIEGLETVAHAQKHTETHKHHNLHHNNNKKQATNMNCQKCQKQIYLPFKCPYCGGYFCSEHRLPENHECPQIEQARTPRQETRPITIQKQKQYEYTITYPPTTPTRTKIHFSNKEIKHLTIAALIIIGIGLSPGIYPDILNELGGLFMLAAFALILTTSFFTHEIAHKIAAQRRKLWAEFRLTFIGAILTLISIISPLFKIISPGAVMVAGPTDKESMGKISIAGPTTNIVLSTTFLAASLLLPENTPIVFILIFGAFFNAWIALFNLIPFGILDGYKIFLWNKKIWTSAFTVSLILTITSYIII